MKTPYFIVQLHHKFLKYIYTLVLGKQIFIVYPLNTTGEGFLKSIVLKLGKSDLFC